MCYVKLPNSLKRTELEKKLTDTIKKRIRDMHNHIDIRLHPDLILLACNLVENSDIDKLSKKKIDKKDFVINLLSNIYSYVDGEKKQVSDIIESRHANGDIKKISIYKKCKRVFFEWVKKKLL